MAFTVARNTHKLRINGLNSIKALTPSSLSFQVSLDHKTYYPEIVFCLISLSQGLCKTDGACVLGFLMLLKEQWKSVSSQGLAPEFDSFLFLPHLVQLVLSSRTGHLAHSFVSLLQGSLTVCLICQTRAAKEEPCSCAAAGSTTAPKPCAGRNTHAMLCWACAAIPIQAQASLAVASEG